MKLSKENYEFLFKFVVLVLADYFSFSHPNLTGAAQRLAADLIETRPTWKAADFVNLCKFFRQNPSLIKTQASMTPELFISNVSVYEEHRAMEFEKYQREKLGDVKDENRLANPLVEKLAMKFRSEGKLPTGDREFGRLAEQAAARQESKRTVLNGGGFESKPKPKTPAPDQTYFEKEHGLNP